jgi:hypothetical protein
LFLCFFVFLFFVCFFVSLFLCFFVSLFLCFFVCHTLTLTLVKLKHIRVHSPRLYGEADDESLSISKSHAPAAPLAAMSLSDAPSLPFVRGGGIVRAMVHACARKGLPLIVLQK